jgi:hypothetical protein
VVFVAAATSACARLWSTSPTAKQPVGPGRLRTRLRHPPRPRHSYPWPAPGSGSSDAEGATTSPTYLSVTAASLNSSRLPSQQPSRPDLRTTATEHSSVVQSCPLFRQLRRGCRPHTVSSLAAGHSKAPQTSTASRTAPPWPPRNEESRARLDPRCGGLVVQRLNVREAAAGQSHQRYQLLEPFRLRAYSSGVSPSSF